MLMVELRCVGVKSHNTALAHAAQRCHLKIVELLITRGLASFANHWGVHENVRDTVLGRWEVILTTLQDVTGSISADVCRIFRVVAEYDLRFPAKLAEGVTHPGRPITEQRRELFRIFKASLPSIAVEVSRMVADYTFLRPSPAQIFYGESFSQYLWH